VTSDTRKRYYSKFNLKKPIFLGFFPCKQYLQHCNLIVYVLVDIWCSSQRTRIQAKGLFSICFVLGGMQGRIQDFKLGGGALKKNCGERREARKFLGYFVWKITILRQKIIFFPIAKGGAKILGYFVWKITILRQKIIFFSNFRGGARRVRSPPWIRPWDLLWLMVVMDLKLEEMVNYLCNK
jgi:hypothetical protein